MRAFPSAVGLAVLQSIHLGAVHEAHAGSGADLDRCLQKANVTWTAWRGYWAERGVPLQRRLRVFRAAMHGSLLSGLEAWSPSAAGVQLLERSVLQEITIPALGRRQRQKQ